jgi:hypothetical protein
MVTNLMLAASLAWGISNSGDSQQILIDHYTSGIIQGIAGEDIHPLVNTGQKKQKVTVAVLDTGVDLTHPSLKDSLVLPGFNAITNSSDIKDTHGHGTHVSGIIAAKGIDDGFAGVSDHAMILPIKVVQTGPNAPIRPQDLVGDAGTALTENVAKGITEAVNRGAQIIHLSLAWPASIHSLKVDQAVALAKSKNVLIVSSAGNDSTLAQVYPCIYEEVICVGAHGPDGAISHFSNYGPMVDLLAPGISILSTWPMNKNPVTFAGQVGYEFRNGTSMAAPFVTGALAELISLGYSADEAKARILAGTRATRQTSLFRSEIRGRFSQKAFEQKKSSRFGNLDLSLATSIAPSPLILPVNKGVMQIYWDGFSPTVEIPISWRNHWQTAKNGSITISDQKFKFDTFETNATIETPIRIPVHPDQDSSLSLDVQIESEGFSQNRLQIPVSIIRLLTRNTLPQESLIVPMGDVPIRGVSGDRDYSVRSVINADDYSRADFLIIKDYSNGAELSLIQGSTSAPSSEVTSTFKANGLDSGSLLNAYRLPDGSYCVIFSKTKAGAPRPDFLLEYLDSGFQFQREVKIGTDLTVLSENFKWAKINGGFSPLWISLGFTPKPDLPPYDPWNPGAKDLKSPKVFFIDQGALRVVHLSRDQLPLQILPDHRILVSSGNSYLQNYSLLTLSDGAVMHQEPLTLSAYRMLVGLAPGQSTLRFDGKKSSAMLLTGDSVPGSLRLSLLGDSKLTFDETLDRTSPLDSLVSVLGAFADEQNTGFFIETHFDLLYYSRRSKNPLSTSLNRYSYIPSMIFSKGFYPVLIKPKSAPEAVGQAGIYVPATLANGMISEIILADEEQKQLRHVLKYHFKTDSSCTGLGNLIPARADDSAYQVFWCGTDLVKIPLVSITSGM